LGDILSTTPGAVGHGVAIVDGDIRQIGSANTQPCGKAEAKDRLVKIKPSPFTMVLGHPQRRTFAQIQDLE
jgi:hypothetical protein